MIAHTTYQVQRGTTTKRLNPEKNAYFMDYLSDLIEASWVNEATDTVTIPGAIYDDIWSAYQDEPYYSF